MTTCLSCSRGFYDECGHAPSESTEATGRTLEFADVDEEIKRYKHNEISTSGGRKRAAELYPLDREKDCEWRLLSECGGGKVPILGCIGGKQVNRHHGPVKLTTRNERDNVHLICSPCHNLWHAKNDSVYDEVLFGTMPHIPRKMTPAEMLRTR